MKITIQSILVIAFLFGTNITTRSQTMKNDTFKHTVYFWLKNPQNQEERKQFETSLKKFIDQSKYVQSKHLGTPANTDREVVDNTYTYALLLGFKSKEDQDKYQAEKAHLVFVEESSRLWKKVLVYDSIAIW